MNELKCCESFRVELERMKLHVKKVFLPAIESVGIQQKQTQSKYFARNHLILEQDCKNNKGSQEQRKYSVHYLATKHNEA